MTSSDNTKNSPLGKSTTYPTDYDASLLFPIERKPMREKLGITGSLPFFGLDFWNAYELSWLNLRGKPQVGIMNFSVSADSPNIVESKSLKLYLNSFTQTRMDEVGDLIQILRTDLSNAFGSPVQVSIRQPDVFQGTKLEELNGLSIDRLDIGIDKYTPDSSFLKSNNEEFPVEETLVSNLLKTNCPVTGQPDWASLQIHYAGPQIDQEGLLKYIISLRSSEDFHEQCVERIFLDILKMCKPQSLTVYARYTRRGGIDINPWRSNFSSGKRPQTLRHARQ